MHCLVDFHPNRKFIPIGDDADKAWAVTSYECPACNRINLFLVNAEEFVYTTNVRNPTDMIKQIGAIPIRPKGSNRPPCPAEVPPELAEDYTEACIVLFDSPKASAALSRRCLQHLLREAAKVKHGDLASEIQQVIDSSGLPSNLADAIDAVRNIGNFAAHPMKSTSTGQILPVEPEEAEWNLDVLEELFDYYYVKPARLAKKRTALNAKLQDAGKLPMK